MREDTLKEIAERGIRVKEMIQNAPGWKDIEKVIEDVRKEAFTEWSELPLSAGQDKVLMIRSKELVLRDLSERIREIVNLGDEASSRIERGESEAHRYDFKPEVPSDSEIQRLMKPLRNIASQIFGRDNPNGAAKEKAEAR